MFNNYTPYATGYIDSLEFITINMPHYISIPLHFDFEFAFTTFNVLGVHIEWNF